MELTVTLEKEQWEFILEAISLGSLPQIKTQAINILSHKLEEEFRLKTIHEEDH